MRPPYCVFHSRYFHGTIHPQACGILLLNCESLEMQEGGGNQSVLVKVEKRI